jgi:ABC-type polysaccharide/polyol phosphate export permease
MTASGEKERDDQPPASSIAAQDPGQVPPPEYRFRKKVNVLRALREIWRSRELVRSLAERDIRARYKQTFLGFGWALFTPFLLMLAFTLFFHRVAKINTGSVPYPLFSYLGLLPWTLFATSMNVGGTSLLNNNTLLNKVYCPREVFPIAAVFVGLFDMVMSASLLVVLFVVYGYAPRGEAIFVPVFFVIHLVFTLAATLLVSIVIIYLRDLKNVVPLILQFGIFATPVAYSLAMLPHRLLPYYVALNPLGEAIDGYRRTALYGLAPQWHLVGIAAAGSAAMFAAAYYLFKRLEVGIADLA